MKTNQWKPSALQIGSHKAIKNTESQELELNGKYGFIWQHNDTHFKVCITSHVVANREFNADRHAGEDTIRIIPNQELDKWVDILKIKRNRNSMAKRANNF